jgi:hypothetical protein
MSKDKVILLFIWFATIGILVKYVPKNQIRHGTLAFLYKQMITWLFGMLVVEKGLIKYPIRFFKKANKTSFSFEYFFYPAFCALFNIHYPEKSNKFIKLLYHLSHTGFLTLGEVLAERYTNLIQYVKWKWYWSFITMGFTYYSSRRFSRWFFKEEFRSDIDN